MFPPGRAALATKPAPTGVRHLREDDRHDAGFLLQGCQRRVGCDQDHVRLSSDQLFRMTPHELRITRGPAFIEVCVPPLDPAQGLQGFSECCNARLPLGVSRNSNQYANAPHALALLRACRERPSSHRAAEQRDEVAPFHSITSSASANNLSGIVRPSALAVFRLMTSSNLVGCITGRSIGFSPLRIRPT